MNIETAILLFGFSVPVLLTATAFIIGSWIERRHFRRIRRRENELRDVLAFSIRRTPDDMVLSAPHLVTGNAVISIDGFKRHAAILRSIIGGRVGVYESLFERARREALVRMKEAARREGSDIILNVKLDASRISIGSGGNVVNVVSVNVVSVEALAYGTAYRRTDEAAEIY